MVNTTYTCQFPLIIIHCTMNQLKHMECISFVIPRISGLKITLLSIVCCINSSWETYDGKHVTLLIHSKMLNIYLFMFEFGRGGCFDEYKHCLNMNKFCTVYIKSMCFIEYFQKVKCKMKGRCDFRYNGHKFII